MSELSEQQLQEINRVIGDPRRFEILRHVAATSCMACSDLRTQFPISAATLSHHLKELEAAGLVATEKRGKFVDVTFRRKVWKQYLGELKGLLTESVCAGA